MLASDIPNGSLWISSWTCLYKVIKVTLIKLVGLCSNVVKVIALPGKLNFHVYTLLVCVWNSRSVKPQCQVLTSLSQWCQLGILQFESLKGGI